MQQGRGRLRSLLLVSGSFLILLPPSTLRLLAASSADSMCIVSLSTSVVQAHLCLLTILITASLSSTSQATVRFVLA